MGGPTNSSLGAGLLYKHVDTSLRAATYWITECVCRDPMGGEKPTPTLSEVRKSKLLSTVQLEVKQKVVTVWKDFVRD